jgi:hypothetical protein
MKRVGLVTMLVVGTMAASAGTAQAAWKYVNVGGATSAIWNSCPSVAVGSPCAFTLLFAETRTADPDGSTQRDCVFVQQVRGIKLSDFGLQGNDNTFADACGAARVQVDAALGHAIVSGTLPARNCHFDLATLTETCTPTTIGVDVAWDGTGAIQKGSALTYRYSYETGQRCLFHANPSRQRTAVTSGGIDGLPAPMGALQDAAQFSGGVVNVGTDVSCFD